jgi:hypothetical protein
MSNLGAVPLAKIGDKLVTTRSSTCGFAAVGKPDGAISLLPGTELAFEKDIKYYRRFSLLRFSRDYRSAKFQRFNIGKSRDEHDALEFPDGRIVMVSELVAGQTATVVQVPPSAQPVSPP